MGYLTSFFLTWFAPPKKSHPIPRPNLSVCFLPVKVWSFQKVACNLAAAEAAILEMAKGDKDAVRFLVIFIKSLSQFNGDPEPKKYPLWIPG